MVASASKAASRKKLPLPPTDPVGARFCEYFNHPWNCLSAPVPEPGSKPQWTTKNRYPLQPRNLWATYKDPNIILGLRFGSQTRYALIDIDRGSDYHPNNDPEKFQLILQAAEKIGLCRHLPVQSSSSGGLHIYFFLSEPVPTLGLASAIKFALLDQGLQLSGGQLEIFPNVKPYSKGKPTNYNGHRLPLQAGSYLLDTNLQPLTNDISRFLDVASMHGTKQDMSELKEALAAAQQRQKLSYLPHTTNRAEVWKRHLETRIREGWTASGQTNELLKDIGTYGVVWLALSGQQLINYIEKTAINAPGYQQYCSHQHEIGVRAREWAVTTESFYSPYCSYPERSRTYSDTFNKDTSSGAANNAVPFGERINEQRSAMAQERIKNALSHLDATNTLPSAATARAKALIATTKQLFGVTVSHKTLYKPSYLNLWHPKFHNQRCEINQPETVSNTSTQAEIVLVEPLENLIEEPEPSSGRDSQEIPTPPPYMKVLYAPSASDAPQRHPGAAGSDSKEGYGEEKAVEPSSEVPLLWGCSDSERARGEKVVEPSSEVPLFMRVKVKCLEWRRIPKNRGNIERWVRETPGVVMTSNGPVLETEVVQTEVVQTEVVQPPLVLEEEAISSSSPMSENPRLIPVGDNLDNPDLLEISPRQNGAAPIGKKCLIQQITGTHLDQTIEWVEAVMVSIPNPPRQGYWAFKLDSGEWVPIFGEQQWRLL
ncbi:hypothetical protein H6F50_19675 [Coleofasciculus sp. FACHB-712]|uniref:hypothetical protein n=1 Tax=Coleofasciculus sp. FACHB-712 TaxID=2692789 RepID=UPI00168250C8|nr:hypothetical protein [Coleofasciculus sp. FACHB-712]MBD1944550.1 hypothetical protein [Coleofasciculus sp. FACHB-712]